MAGLVDRFSGRDYYYVEFGSVLFLDKDVAARFIGGRSNE
jgi:hypothetical protein